MREGDGYCFTISNIIKKLEITEEEQKHLAYLKESWVSEGRHLSQKEKNHADHLARLERQGKRPKSVTIRERRKDIENLLDAGVSRTEILAKWKISDRTFAYDIAWIKKEKNALTNAEIFDSNDARTPANAPDQKKTKSRKAKSSKRAVCKTHKKTSEKAPKKTLEGVQKVSYGSGKWFERKAKAEAQAEERRKEIKKLLNQGFSRAAIRRKLGIGDTTLRNYIARIEEDEWDNAHAVVFSFDDDRPFTNLIAQGKAMSEQGVDADQKRPDNREQSDKSVEIPGVEDTGNLIPIFPR